MRPQSPITDIHSPRFFAPQANKRPGSKSVRYTERHKARRGGGRIVSGGRWMQLHGSTDVDGGLVLCFGSTTGILGKGALCKTD